ncbi:MAG: transcriptional regulator, family, partial [Sphaerisporangium sp.]|nr:transcriptional regulator, family [Sphaerisporangium sp.]
EFRSLWSSHEVRGKTHEPKYLIHPDVGPLTLTYQAFDIRSAPDQQMIIYHPEPASPSANALALLSTLHATAQRAHLGCEQAGVMGSDPPSPGTRPTPR